MKDEVFTSMIKAMYCIGPDNIPTTRFSQPSIDSSREEWAQDVVLGCDASPTECYGGENVALGKSFLELETPSQGRSVCNVRKGS